MRSASALTLILSLCLTTARIMVDLTHTLDENAPKYPVNVFGIENMTLYNKEKIAADYFGDAWLELYKMEYYEHQGTHIDAPSHFGKGRQSLDEIPTEKLIGPGVILNIKDKARANPDYFITVDDLKDHEAKHGIIPRNAIIIMNSGWGYKYPHPTRVFGSENLQDPRSFHFPGFSIEACEWLLTRRQVSVLGTDTPSPDPGQTEKYFCHMLLQPNNVPLLEYVANLDSIPERGTTIIVGSMKVRGGSGGPTRVLAIVDNDTLGFYSSGDKIVFQCMVVIFSALLSYSL